VISTQIAVIRRVLMLIVPGWIVASPSRASRSSNAFAKPMPRRRENFIRVGRRSIGIVRGGLAPHGKALAPAAQHTKRVRWPITTY
jgi:hypothetical protein